jgi:hypothetical protein
MPGIDTTALAPHPSSPFPGTNPDAIPTLAGGGAGLRCFVLIPSDYPLPGSPGQAQTAIQERWNISIRWLETSTGTNLRAYRDVIHLNMPFNKATVLSNSTTGDLDNFVFDWMEESTAWHPRTRPLSPAETWLIIVRGAGGFAGGIGVRPDFWHIGWGMVGDAVLSSWLSASGLEPELCTFYTGFADQFCTPNAQTGAAVHELLHGAVDAAHDSETYPGTSIMNEWWDFPDTAVTSVVNAQLKASPYNGGTVSSFYDGLRCFVLEPSDNPLPGPSGAGRGVCQTKWNVIVNWIEQSSLINFKAYPEITFIDTPFTNAQLLNVEETGDLADFIFDWMEASTTWKPRTRPITPAESWLIIVRGGGDRANARDTSISAENVNWAMVGDSVLTSWLAETGLEANQCVALSGLSAQDCEPNPQTGRAVRLLLAGAFVAPTPAAGVDSIMRNWWDFPDVPITQPVSDLIEGSTYFLTAIAPPPPPPPPPGEPPPPDPSPGPVPRPIPQGGRYIPVGWNELPPGDVESTPISARHLNHMDQGIRRTHAEPMTTAQRNILRGADLFTGRMIFNTDAERFEVYIGHTPQTRTGLTSRGWLRLPVFFDLPGPPLGRVATRRFMTADMPLTGNFKAILWDGIDRTAGIFMTSLGGMVLIPQQEGLYHINVQVMFSRMFGGPFITEIRRNAFVDSDHRGPISSTAGLGPPLAGADLQPVCQSLQTTAFLDGNDTISVHTRRGIATGGIDVVRGRDHTFIDIYRIN